MLAYTVFAKMLLFFSFIVFSLDDLLDSLEFERYRFTVILLENRF